MNRTIRIGITVFSALLASLFAHADWTQMNLSPLVEPQSEGMEIKEPAIWTNHALGKPVSGQDGASHGRGLARHLTDGDPSTHAKPPTSHFSYVVKLAAEPADGVRVEALKISWGRFGDYFSGIRKADGQWAHAAWAGEYVTHYTVEARMCESQDWVKIHEWKGRPSQEFGKHVWVTRQASNEPGVTSLVTTEIRGLDLEGVSDVRIQAKGSHWIGLFELEVLGPLKQQ